MIKSANHVVTNLTDIIDNNTATPEKIRELAEQIQQYTLQLQPDQIQTLAEQIDEAVSHLESIIRNTEHDLKQQDYAPSRIGLGREPRQSIKRANEDIQSVKIDLEEIDKETDDAYNRAIVAAGKVDELETRLNKLHVSNVQNQQDAEEIIKQAETVKESANNAHVLRLGISLQLKDTYKTAVATLTVRSNASESARERAQNLLNRASKNTVETTFQLKKFESGICEEEKLELQKLIERVPVCCVPSTRSSYIASGPSCRQVFNAVQNDRSAHVAEHVPVTPVARIDREEDRKKNFPWERLYDLEADKIELHKTYESNQKDLDSLESKIQGLTEQINTHLNKIQSDADRYRQCTT
ncbi:laminin subunit beta-1 [Culex quinquefasciatus]|uniref:laminin subunit beta-1 n=1 Tax=Culex quinquefasciatus TaxID=7176 RepID=UPI0018E2EC7E|nr:laminin subunit beta-1 [Culex quinquefasciatus]